MSHNCQAYIQAACLLVLYVVAANAGAEPGPFQRYNRTRDILSRLERSALWERESPPIDRHLSFFPVDSVEDQAVKAARGERDVSLNFRPLCQVNRVRKEFKEKGYEFRPPYYDEVTCKTQGSEFPGILKGNQCVYPFTCVQRRRELFVTRRGFADGCWETVSVIVPSSCECMWPDSNFGGDLEV